MRGSETASASPPPEREPLSNAAVVGAIENACNKSCDKVREWLNVHMRRQREEEEKQQQKEDEEEDGEYEREEEDHDVEIGSSAATTTIANDARETRADWIRPKRQKRAKTRREAVVRARGMSPSSRTMTEMGSTLTNLVSAAIVDEHAPSQNERDPSFCVATDASTPRQRIAAGAAATTPSSAFMPIEEQERDQARITHEVKMTTL